MFGYLQPDSVELFRVFHLNGKIPKSLNATFITLIPKKSDALHIQGFRPINLISVPYEIIVEVLSNKIRTVLREVIDDNQYAFIKERNILNSILIGNESWKTIGEGSKKVLY